MAIVGVKVSARSKSPQSRRSVRNLLNDEQVGEMPNHPIGHQPSREDGDAALSEIDAFDTVLGRGRYGVAPESGVLRPADQVALDIAEIERAAAALRKAEPGLEAWTTSSNNELPPVTPRKPRPVWLLIGILWLATALGAAGAVVAIARLAG
jgi:hypothetical protein